MKKVSWSNACVTLHMIKFNADLENLSHPPHTAMSETNSYSDAIQWENSIRLDGVWVDQLLLLLGNLPIWVRKRLFDLFKYRGYCSVYVRHSGIDYRRIRQRY
eukprot:GHVH01006162.1.p1 GENE.GHVH01006162.1~~GHVH01006162.1.p1  ORF type:complete len:103 (+),score=4.04 GHVH01006162.1:2-310(+)